MSEIRGTSALEWRLPCPVKVDEVFFPGLSLTPRKLGTTRLYMHPDTDAPFEEHVITVREEPNLHLELANLMSLWNASPWKRPIDAPKSFLMTVTVAKKLEDTMQTVFELGFRPTCHEERRPRCGFVTFVTGSTRHVYM